MNSSRALATHRFFVRAAFSFAHTFAWLFIFLFFSTISTTFEATLLRTVLLFAIIQVVACLVMPFAASHLQHGMRRAMVYGIVAALFSFAMLGSTLLGYFESNYELAIVMFALAMGLYQGVYRIPYTLEVRENKESSKVLNIAPELLLALLPSIAGLIISQYSGSYAWIQFSASLLLVCSLLCLPFVGNVYERFTWGYRETFGHIFLRENRRKSLLYIMEGIESATLVLIWPLAIFFIVGYSFLTFGLLLSATFFVGLLVQIISRKFEAPLITHSLPIAVTISVTAWVARLLVVTPLSILIVDVFADVKGKRHGAHAPLYLHPGDNGTYLDEHTALKEIARSIGRIILCVGCAITAAYFSIGYAFLAAFIGAAIAAAYAIILTRRPDRIL